MSRILVFQHVAAEPLGTLDALIRARGHRIRFVNFGRNPDARPSLDRYHGLIVLGGPMNIGDPAHLHLEFEMDALRRAVAAGIPTLGICLGCQLLATALGGSSGPAPTWEIGWRDVKLTDDGERDPVMGHLASAPVFQWHGCTFDLPDGAKLLATGDAVHHQAFRYGDLAYGLQFHLEMEQQLIERWLNHPAYGEELKTSELPDTDASIRKQTRIKLPIMRDAAEKVFNAFLDRVGTPSRRKMVPSR